MILARGEDWRGLAGRVALAESVAAYVVGDLEKAEVHFERALKTFRRYCLAWEEAEALELRARCLAGLGRRHRSAALESLKAAVEVYRRIGCNERWSDHIESERRRVLGRAMVPTATYPDGLTEREADVLRLIAGGQSNRGIAGELVISVRTVERHITNIYAKIGARGKADATAYALRHSLV